MWVKETTNVPGEALCILLLEYVFVSFLSERQFLPLEYVYKTYCYLYTHTCISTIIHLLEILKSVNIPK